MLDKDDIAMIDTLGFPADLIPPEEKDTEAYALAWSKAVYNNYNNGNTAFSLTQKYEFSSNWAFAEGNQSVTSNVATLGQQKEKEQGEGMTNFLDIDFTPLGFMNKMIRIVEQKLIQGGHKFRLKPIDPTSTKEKRDAMSRLKAKMALQGFAEQALGVDISEGEYIPKNDQEAVIYEKMGYKNAYAAVGQIILKDVYDIQNQYEYLVLPKTLRWLTSCGFAVEKIWFDKSGRIKHESVDLRNVICAYSDEMDFSSSKYRGRYKDYTISELRQLVPDGTFSTSDWKTIAESWCGKNGNNATIPLVDPSITSSYITPYGLTFDNFRVTVQEIEWITSNTYSETETTAQVWYESSYIVNTNYVYAYGMKANQTRGIDKTLAPHSDYIMIKVSPVETYLSRSLVQRMKPLEKQLQNAWIKLQNACAKAKGRTTWYNIVALMNAINTNIDGVKDWGQLLNMADDTNRGVYSSTQDFGNANANAIFQVEDGGIGELFKELMEVMQTCNAWMQQITGINSVAASENPQERLGKAVAELSLDSADAAISDIKQALKYMLLNGASVVLSKAQRLLQEPDNMYSQGLSEVSEDILALAGNFSHRAYAIDLTLRSSAEDIKALKDLMGQLLIENQQDPSKGITPSEYLYFEDMVEEEPEFVRYFLAYREDTKAKQAAQQKQQDVANNANAQQQSAQESFKQEMQIMSSKLEGELKKISAKGDEDRKSQQQEILAKFQEMREEFNMEMHKDKFDKAHEHIQNQQERKLKLNLNTQKQNVAV